LTFLRWQHVALDQPVRIASNPRVWSALMLVENGLGPRLQPTRALTC
jgi:hypothetical protein